MNAQNTKNLLFNGFKKFIKEPDYQDNSNFLLFEKKNIFHENIYKEMISQFPEYDFFNIDQNIKKDENKHAFSSLDKNFNIFLDHSPIWKIFFELVNSQPFFNLVYNKYFSAKQSQNRFKKKWKTKKDSKFYDRFFRIPVETRVHFSILRNGASISPHTDVPAKLFGMIFFLPSEDLKEIGNNGSTIFWKAVHKKSIWHNWENEHLNDKQTKNFNKTHERFHISPFEKNKAIGFVKNAISWHSVDEFISSENLQDRKSLNLFVRYV